jgi:hypothetical protein
LLTEELRQRAEERVCARTGTKALSSADSEQKTNKRWGFVVTGAPDYYTAAAFVVQKVTPTVIEINATKVAGLDTFFDLTYSLFARCGRGD